MSIASSSLLDLASQAPLAMVQVIRRHHTGFVLLASGIVARVAAELMLPAQTAFLFAGFSAAVELPAVTLFLLIVLKTSRQSLEPRRPYEKFLAVAILCLIIGTALSTLFFVAKATAGTQAELVRRIALIDGPLRDIQLLGFAAFMIAGVSQCFVRPVYGTTRREPERMNLVFGLMLASLLLNIVSYVAVLLTRNPLFAAGLELAYLLMPVWAVLLVRQLGIFGPATNPCPTLKFIRAAYIWLLVSVFMMPLFIPYGLMTGQHFAHSYMGAHRHAFTVGFISLMMIGVSSKIVSVESTAGLRRRNPLLGPFLLLNIGNAARVLLQVATDFAPAVAYPLAGVTGFVEVLGLAWWGVDLWRDMNSRLLTSISHSLAAVRI